MGEWPFGNGSREHHFSHYIFFKNMKFTCYIYCHLNYKYHQKLMNRGVQDMRNCVMYWQYMCVDRSRTKFSLTPHDWVKERVAVHSIYIYIYRIPGTWKHTGKKSGEMFWNIWVFFSKLQFLLNLKSHQICAKNLI